MRADLGEKRSQKFQLQQKRAKFLQQYWEVTGTSLMTTAYNERGD